MKSKFKIGKFNLLTPIPANKFSVELYSSISCRLNFSGKPTKGYLKENNQLAISNGFSNKEIEVNITYIITNIGKRSIEAIISDDGMDSNNVSINIFLIFSKKISTSICLKLNS